MKTPRLFACWSARRAVSRSLDHLASLPEPARRHLLHCERCRRNYEVESEIVASLSSGSGAARAAAPAFLRARIMFEIRSAPRGGGALIPWRARVAGATALCALAALLFGRTWLIPPSSRPVSRTGVQPALAEISEALRLPNRSQVSQWIGRIDGPLENELRLVVDDAKTAYDSLAGGLLAAGDPAGDPR